MSLIVYTGIVGALLFIIGSVLWVKEKRLELPMLTFFRSQVAAVVVFGSASLWFLYNISQLGEADFGQYKLVLLIVFGIVSLGAFKWVNEFLAVRGLAILALMFSRMVLDAAYMRKGQGLIFLVIFVYIVIHLSLYLGVFPYKARDMIQWLFVKPKRVQLLSLGCIAYGMALILVAVFLGFSNIAQ